MDVILLPNNNKIYTDFRPQTSPQGNDFRLSGVRKDLTKPEKWVDKSIRWHWIYSFKYLDGGFFEIEIDYYNKFVELRK